MKRRVEEEEEIKDDKFPIELSREKRFNLGSTWKLEKYLFFCGYWLPVIKGRLENTLRQQSVTTYEYE